MELTAGQVDLLKKEIGNNRFKEIIYNINVEYKAVFYRGAKCFYKLSRVENDLYAFVSLDDTECYANGTFSKDKIWDNIIQVKAKVFDDFKSALYSGFFNE